MTVHELRLARGMRQQDLAEAAGIGMWLAARLDRDPDRRPRSRAIRDAVASALGVTAPEIWPPTNQR